MFTYSEHVLKKCIAQLCRHVGFKSINELAFEILIDLLSRFILDLGKLSVSIANTCNRTQVNIDDICFAFKSLGLNLDDLIVYLTEEAKLPFAGPLQPNYPVKSKQTIRIQFPTKRECDSRKEFYQDWQPTLSLDSTNQYLTKLDPEQQQNIEHSLEQLDLIDYVEQQRKLKITEDLNLNRKILNKIRSKVNELNIGGFTELEAQVPNYIYLSTDGQALSFGNRPGRLPEARQHQRSTDCKISKSSNQREHSKRSSRSSKKSSTKLSKSEKRKKKDKQRQSIRVDTSRSDQNKTEDQIVSELLNEMISSVEDKFNESFYDENEAAKTLVLLSYDSSKSVLSSTAESPSIDEDENQIDYSLTKFNYDLNNNYSADLNNNSIDLQRKENEYLFNNLINGKLEKSFNNLNDYQLRLNDVKNLTIADDEDADCLNSKRNSSNNLPKLKFKLTFDKYKESLANPTEQPNHHHETNGHSHSTIKHQLNPTTPTKDKQRKKSKKANSINNSSTKKETPLNTSKSTSKKNKTNIPQNAYYCPTCDGPDDGTPMSEFVCF